MQRLRALAPVRRALRAQPLSGSAYAAVIGLEVHAQLACARKAYCDCLRDAHAPPNTLTCGVCLGHPGALPVANSEAVALGVRAAAALGCARVAAVVSWDRKNYFYPDLPKGYQITQQREPLARDGFVEIEADAAARGGDASAVDVRVLSLHLEEDSAGPRGPAF